MSPALDAPSLALWAQGLCQSYRSGFWLRAQEVLSDIQLELPRGGRLALLGPNGSGKSTLLRLCLGLERPSRGRLTVLGGDPRSGAIRRRIGFGPDGTPFPLRVPLEELLATLARLQCLSAREARLLARQRLGDFGLEAARRKPLAHCSLGMRRRFVLAQCFLVPRDLYLLDEPSAGLDAAGQVLLEAQLQAGLKQGASLVIASHEGGEWARCADELLLLVAGRVRRRGSIAAQLAQCDAIEAEWRGPAALESARSAAAEHGLTFTNPRPAPELLRAWYQSAASEPRTPPER